MRRKGESDALNSVNEPRWLVVRDRLSQVVTCQALAPKVDLRAALSAERDRRVAQGWHADVSPRQCALYFCDRGEERVCGDRVLRAGVAKSDRVVARVMRADAARWR
jgi:hypothetical protein